MCSAAADSFDGAVAHLKARDVTFLCASRAPLEKLQSYKRRMGVYHQLLDRTQKGRVEDFRAFRHNEYEEDAAQS
jgi:predicted dithiol-disulfide oxidoreductase (DUF899 family)